jgi:hypothetical protein
VPLPAPGSLGVTTFTETEFSSGGMAHVLHQVGPLWAATMRPADPIALHRSAFGLRAGTKPTARKLLISLPIPRTFLVGARSQPLSQRSELEAAGVRVVTIPDAGHNIMLATRGHSQNMSLTAKSLSESRPSKSHPRTRCSQCCCMSRCSAGESSSQGGSADVQPSRCVIADTEPCQPSPR